MKLKKLFAGLPIKVKGSSEVLITGISNHSKLVAPGNLFIAKKGDKDDGTLYISDAKAFGAVAILTDLYNPFIKGVVQVITDDVAKIEAMVAARYYGEPSKKMDVIGITGTNGKTTTAYITRHLLNKKCSTALIGTIERAFQDEATDSQLTTPGSIEVQKYLHEVQGKGAQVTVMEVTSHALTQHRVTGVDFDVAVFTNLSEEHLDYHKDMQSYFDAKKQLFTKSKASCYHVINGDDPWGKKLIAISKAKNLITFGMQEEVAIRASDVKGYLGKTTFNVHYNGACYPAEIAMTGLFNVYNACAALGVCLASGLSMQEATSRLKSFKGVSGRMQWLKAKTPYHICIDFGHTSDALEKTLKALNAVKTGRIITLFGCGGDRDPFKREKMAKVAEAFSDLVVITSDNARSEDPKAILEAIAKGFSKKEGFVKLEKRDEAIEFAIKQAKPGDIVLIAGRGHESHLHIGDKKIPFDDRQVALAFAEKHREG